MNPTSGNTSPRSTAVRSIEARDIPHAMLLDARVAPAGEPRAQALYGALWLQWASRELQLEELGSALLDALGQFAEGDFRIAVLAEQARLRGEHAEVLARLEACEDILALDVTQLEFAMATCGRAGDRANEAELADELGIRRQLRGLATRFVIAASAVQGDEPPQLLDSLAQAARCLREYEARCMDDDRTWDAEVYEACGMLDARVAQVREAHVLDHAQLIRLAQCCEVLPLGIHAAGLRSEAADLQERFDDGARLLDRGGEQALSTEALNELLAVFLRFGDTVLLHRVQGEIARRTGAG